VEASFLQALDGAARTASHDRGRFACNRILLRGRDGAVIGTDGRQLLVQQGYSLPWTDDRLLPALPVFGCRELPKEELIRLGCIDNSVTLQIGSWLLALQADRTSRYPDVDKVIPTPGAGSIRLRLADEDVKLLLQALPRLPVLDDPHRPITLDLPDRISIRASAGMERVEEVALPQAQREGPALQVVMDRRYLLRALQLGFTEVLLTSAAQPLLCRDARRIYVWMPLSDATPVPPAKRDRTTSHSESPSRGPYMLEKQPNHVDEQHPGAKQTQPCDAQTEAEALRGQLQAALARTSRLIASLKQQRRQSRAVRAAMAALRRLQS
jgi:hypothetical protein